MCGIAGCIEPFDGVREEVLLAMGEKIAARGPDSFGVWVDSEAPIGFSHRRLSILDLSPLGHQPMHSASGRYTITFNGEVFNFKEIAREVDQPLRGGSDTEVMLAAFERWGIAEAVKRFVGMFAFAVWDRKRRELTLVRDRLGIKPLYYGTIGRSFVFSSEIKAMRAHPSWSGELSADGVQLFTEYGYVPAPWSIISGVWKLPPGCTFTLPLEALGAAEIEPRPGVGSLSPSRYWSIADVAGAGQQTPFEGTAEDLLEELDSRIGEAVRLRMISDVPLGAFLSGGIDSSLVVSHMQRSASGPVKTFSIGFGVERYNEAPYAKEVARHLGTDHTELEITADMALDLVPRAASLADEPFGDSSIIPTFLVSQLARKHVTVALSGDGGDELFGGYDRYSLLAKVGEASTWIPRPLRSAGALLGEHIPHGVADRIQVALRRTGFFPYDLHNADEKLRRTLSLLTARTPHELYIRAIKHWPRGAGLIPGARDIEAISLPELSDLRAYMALVDTSMYLPDDILTKVDRASMACSLEARVPLLDHRLVEFAHRVPTTMKYRDGRGKWPLRALVRRYVPPAIIDRPKKGFAIPLDDWLRGPLRPWAEEFLNSEALTRSGVFEKSVVRRVWEEHLSGQRNMSQLLWNVLMFQGWYLESMK